MASPAKGKVQAKVRRTGWTAGMRNSAAISGPNSQSIAPKSNPNPTEAENAACSCRGSSTGRCTIAGAMPSCEKIVENPITTVAAPTTPKFAGLKSRARRNSTTRRRIPYTAFPPPVQTRPARVRAVKSASSVCGPLAVILWALMAAPRAAIGEGVASRGDELPGVSRLEERQLDDAVALAREYLAVRLPRKQRVRHDPARAYGELPNAVVRIRRPVGGLRRETLVHFIARAEHDLGPGRVEIIPERLARVIHDRRPRGGVEARDVPNGQRAQLGARGQVGLEPLLMERPGGH